jgi:hypothetical protein
MPVVGSCPAAQDVGARDRRGDRHREIGAAPSPGVSVTDVVHELRAKIAQVRKA